MRAETELPQNHLADATSPYLRQHVHNPVDWYPWGRAALERAKREERPIFLSIGYSACHWCHVMAHESFEDPEVARALNAAFVCIKVDREERPDLDDIYMTAAQLMTGSGGWPLSVFLTPDLKPFYAGTYFPPEDRHGLPGFIGVVTAIAAAWHDRRAEVEKDAAALYAAVAGALVPKPGAGTDLLTREVIARAVEAVAQSYDPEWGGFGGPPKFPPHATLDLLLKACARQATPALSTMLTHTLDRMMTGGIADQVGGGFHRYAVDREWIVPHFEKMLSDNALLARVYLEASQVTGNTAYRHVGQRTLDYLLREMQAPAGGFYASQDADSPGGEGAYYVWGKAELEALLPPDDRALAVACFGVTPGGNFEGSNILCLAAPPADLARVHALAPAELETRLDAIADRLRHERERRAPPGRDDKILAVWNGMTVSSLARAFQITGEARYLQAAEDAMRFLLTRLLAADGLARCFADGRRSGPAFLDDYGACIIACVDLYESTFAGSWLASATELTVSMVAQFWDHQANQGFFFTSTAHDGPDLRVRPAYDGATPSGTALACTALLRLGRLTGNDDWLTKAETVLRQHAETLEKAPQATLFLMGAADLFLSPAVEIAIVGANAPAAVRELLRAVYEIYLPNRVLAGSPQTPAAEPQPVPVPLLEGKRAKAGEALAFVCVNRVCGPPIASARDLRDALKKARSAFQE